MDSSPYPLKEPSRLWLVVLIPVIGSFLIYICVVLYQRRRRRHYQRHEKDDDDEEQEDVFLGDPDYVPWKPLLRRPSAPYFGPAQRESECLPTTTTPAQLESGWRRQSCRRCFNMSPPAYHELLLPPPKYDDLVYEDNEPLSDIQHRIASTLSM